MCFEFVVILIGVMGDFIIKWLMLDICDMQFVFVWQFIFELVVGGWFELFKDSFDVLWFEIVKMILVVGGVVSIDVVGFLVVLDWYFYGCMEQIISCVLLFFYFSEVVEVVGLGGDDVICKWVMDVIVVVFVNQFYNGFFGLWNSYSSVDIWFDVYVVDFLMCVCEKGYWVLDLVFIFVFDNLENWFVYVFDFENGGEDIVYVFYVLVCNGWVFMGDLCYYLDVKLSSFVILFVKV